MVPAASPIVTDPRLGKLRCWAEKDLRLSPLARLLILNVYSNRATARGVFATEPFELPWTSIARWTGTRCKKHCYKLADEVVSGGYLWDEGTKGCPPTKLYKLNFKLDLAKYCDPHGMIPSGTKRIIKPATVKKHLAAMKAAVR